MKKSRAFQVISSMVIAYVIQNVLIAVLAFPALSYERVYISLVCILMMVSSMARSSSSSGPTSVTEERIVDGQGRTGRVFEQSRYPGIKVLEESSEGKTYISDQGEVVTTKYVITTTGEVNKEDFVIGLSAVILLICMVTLIFSGIVSLFSHKFAEVQNNASEFIESQFAQQSGEETEESDEVYDADESGQNDVPVQTNTDVGSEQNGVSDQVYTDVEYEQNDAGSGVYAVDGNGSGNDPGADPYIEEEEAAQWGNGAVFVDYGIYTDGHGITASEYVIEDSDSRKLTKEDTDRLTLRGINYAKNELFARHGRKFESSELQKFYESRDWYVGSREAGRATDDKIQSEFNSYEKYNCDLLYKLEDSKGMYKLD